MAVGREIVQTGQIPAVDTFSQTMKGQLYPSYSMFWLMEVFFYLIYSVGGPALIVFSHSLMVSAAYAIILYLCWKISGSWRVAAFSMLFAAALGINDWNVRPQAVAFLLGALYLMAIYQLRAGGSRGWLLAFPLGMLVWVNSHGSFFTGFVLLGLWLVQALWDGWRGVAEERWKVLRMALLGLLGAALSALLNPRGLGILSYLAGMLANSPVQNLVTEWAAPSFGTLHGALFLVGLLFTAAGLMVSPKRPTIYQLLTFLFFAALGLRTIRGAIWFGLVMAPVLADHFKAVATLVNRPGGDDRIPMAVTRCLNAILAGLILLMALVSLPWFKDRLPLPELKRGLISVETPVDATEFLLDNQLPGPLFHHMAYGSYLIWAAQPGYPVFIDPRIELYPYSLWTDYITISSAFGDWSSQLDQYGINILFLHQNEQSDLIKAAMHTDRWIQIYQDTKAVIFIRNE